MVRCKLHKYNDAPYDKRLYISKLEFFQHILEGSKSMSKLQHLFKVGQNVKRRIDGIMQKGIVTEVHDDHIIVDIPEINNHCWFEEGFNLDCVYPIYNF